MYSMWGRSQATPRHDELYHGWPFHLQEQLRVKVMFEYLRNKLYAKLFILASRLIKRTTQLDLATMGLSAEEDKITMLIFTTPGLKPKALLAAKSISDEAQLSTLNETVH